jgi:hypothetical protein
VKVPDAFAGKKLLVFLFDFGMGYDKTRKITKENNMGLDQYAHLRNRKINWKKYYSDDEKESQTEQKDVFVWRKHARLQTFMNKQREEEKDKEFNPMDMSHLGMNGYDEVYITEDVVKDLEEEIKSNYPHSFCADGFFWGQQFQEEAVKEYKSQDLKFLKFCKEAIKDGKTVVYTCSW